jgi:acetate kinase
LPRLDALIFTGGIGENAPDIRLKVLQQLRIMGFAVDESANTLATGGQSGVITRPQGPVAMVVNTNEELMIVQQTVQVLNHTS